MPGKPGKEHGLFEDGSLIAFMQSTLDAVGTRRYGARQLQISGN